MLIDAAPLAAFAFASSITPGPNNLMLLASGARFGVRRSAPHMLGVSLGFGVLALCVGFGLARVFDAAPWLETVMKVLAAGFILYLAWKVATAETSEGPSAADAPLTFLQAALFQWINPKAWAMALTAMTIYVAADTPWAVLGAAAIFCAVNFPCILVWTAAGKEIARVLGRPSRRRAFNIAMAVLMVASVALVLA